MIKTLDRKPVLAGRSVKRASTRLLDLLAGWSDYLSRDEDSGMVDPHVTADQIAEAYQAAGALTESWDAMSHEDTERAIEDFVRKRVLPLIFRTGE